MKYIGESIILFLLMLLIFSFTYSQDESGVKYGKVYVSGENPVIGLSLKKDEASVTNVSFWRIIYSPVGMGHVCYVKSDITGNGESKDDIRTVFTDNEKLLDYLNREIMSAFNKEYIENPYPMHKANFVKTGNTLKEWKEIIKSEEYRVELVWKDFYEPFLLDTPVGGERIPYGITSLFIPAKTAKVYINGTKVAGQAFPRMRGKMQSSTAFLAFSETWVK